MKNITKLACWNTLKEIGFTPVKYTAFGRCVAIGASLFQRFTDIQGREVDSDVITIEPFDSRLSKNNYHITGTYIEPKRYKISGTNDFTMSDFCNNYFEPKEILSIVSQLKTSK